jgi:SAM-dependent methyltransferase
MDPHHRQQVARSFGVGPALVPLLPELLADIWSLGSWPGEIARLLGESRGLARRARAMDLGCGKGAVSVPLARELGFRVLGIDLFAPFLEEARARAEEAGVAGLCRFEIGDLRQTVRRLREFDVALLAGVGAGVFGGYSGCVGEMRRAVRGGGFLVVDDGFLDDATGARPPGYEYYRTREETLVELTSFGDELVGERLVPRRELDRCNRRNTRLIRARAGELAMQHPEVADELAIYVRSEEEECEFLESRTRAAIWLLRRGSAGGG